MPNSTLKQSPNLSVVRRGQNCILSELSIDGKVLDLGGSTTAGYQELLKGTHAYTTVNIDKKYGCDLVFDIEQKFPLEDNSYDGVLCHNVIEHVFNFQNVVSESFRVLKARGKAFYAVPFMYYVHGCPDDYFRYTDSALRRMFEVAGFTDIVVTPVAPGLFSLIYQTTEGWFNFLPNFIKNAVKFTFLGIDGLLSQTNAYSRAAARIPLGYTVVAHKK